MKLNTETIVTFRILCSGYVPAYGRFVSASGRQDGTALFNSLFEGLNWTVVLEDRVRRD